MLTLQEKLEFVLTQKEAAILYHVKETLQIGRVKQFLCKKENTVFHRFIVSDILIRSAHHYEDEVQQKPVII